MKFPKIMIGPLKIKIKINITKYLIELEKIVFPKSLSEHFKFLTALKTVDSVLVSVGRGLYYNSSSYIFGCLNLYLMHHSTHYSSFSMLAFSFKPTVENVLLSQGAKCALKKKKKKHLFFFMLFCVFDSNSCF